MVNSSYMLMNPQVLQQHIDDVVQLTRRQDTNMENLKNVVMNPAIAGSGLFNQQAMTSYQQLVKDWDGLKIMLGSYNAIVGNHVESVSTTDARGANALAGETRSA